jgi:osmotically-inducible protein OsmY
MTSDNGVVTLNGSVATEKDKQELENRVERMSGVKDVKNNLQISPQASSSGSSSTSSSR